MKDKHTVQVLADDPHDQDLVSNVHPSRWANPEPTGRYNLVVIGAGTAGLVAAVGAAGLGARVALVEKHLLGGDCLNAGCVPSKGVIRASRAAHEVLTAERFGIRLSGNVEIDFASVMERMRRLRAKISAHDSAQRLKRLGVDLFFGGARFTGGDRVEVGGKTLWFQRAVIATGARAAALPIEGLAEAGYLTNETVFTLTRRPSKLAVIGGGPLGSELAQAFHRLGSQVSLFERSDHLLGREDSDAGSVLQKAFVREGIELILRTVPRRIERVDQGKRIYFDQDGRESSIVVDEILLGVGRIPNVDGLGLEDAGVAYDPRSGVVVNDFLQTTNPRIYAAGDVCLPFKFTHVADAAARLVIQNALFLGKKKWTSLIIPWTTYTDPEVAHVGMYAKDAEEKGFPVETFLRHFGEVDRAILDGDADGFVKVHVMRGSGAILGATIVAAHAGEMINEITLAMAGGLGLKTIADVIHPYPTESEAIRQVGDLYNRTRLTPLVRKILTGWLAVSRMDLRDLKPFGRNMRAGVRHVLEAMRRPR